MVLPVWTKPRFDEFPNQLTHHLGGSDIFLFAETFETGFFLGVNQHAEAGSPLFIGHGGRLLGKGVLGQAWGGSAHRMVLADILIIF